MASRRTRPGNRPSTLGRRTVLKWLAAAPAAGLAARAFGAEEPAAGSAPPELSEYGKFLARRAEGLSRKEKARLRGQMPGLEGALRQLREHELPDDVEPAFTFRPIASKRGGRP